MQSPTRPSGTRPSGILIGLFEKEALKFYTVMNENIRKTLEEFKHNNELKDIKLVITPAADHLFGVNPNFNKFGGNKGGKFHMIAAMA